MQDCRSAQPTVGKQHFVPERMMIGGNGYFRRDASQIAIPASIFCSQQERYKTRSRFANIQAELTGQIVTKGGGPHFRDGQSAGGNH